MTDTERIETIDSISRDIAHIRNVALNALAFAEGDALAYKNAMKEIIDTLDGKR